ncbi:MAG: CoA-binding protein [Dehalococcoidia bacterium]|nr:CoA-binding protein [Dehalococcoidia bacterium]MDD5493077.1 CoA-binding protein [Dehalococcoidia bacterium]
MAQINVHKALDCAFNPSSIAVVGASEQPFSFGYHFLRHLLDYGYKGTIYPVNPSKSSIMGLKAYPSLLSVPTDVDFVICCVPNSRVIPLLKECPLKKVKIVHLFTARLSETGRPQAAKLEKQIQNAADNLGVTLIGPNCMGIYSPSAGIAFGYDFPRQPGDIGVVFQSGGSATLLIQMGSLLGLRFSKAVSYGNAMQIDESDILDYLRNDPSTSIIAAYFEGVKNGQRFINSLAETSKTKPVVVIKGGKSDSGTRSVTSHTAAVAGSQNIWKKVIQQTGAIEVNDLNEMTDLLMLFEYLPPVLGKRVGIIGGGGGKCVTSADLAEEAGLIVPPLSKDMRNKLKSVVPDLWDWLGNPMDFSIWGDSALKAMEAHRLFVESGDFDVVIIQVSDDNPLTPDMWSSIIKMEAEDIINLAAKKSTPVIAVLCGAKPGYEDLQNERWKTLAQQKARLIQAKVPTFETTAEAVKALSRFISYWQKRMAVS